MACLEQDGESSNKNGGWRRDAQFCGGADSYSKMGPVIMGLCAAAGGRLEKPHLLSKA